MPVLKLALEIVHLLDIRRLEESFGLVKTIYNKLVRDRIPEIIRKRGAQCEVRVLEDGEFEQCLKAKLGEEVSEFIGASSVDDRVAEIADIYEVLDGIMEFYQISPQSVIEV